MSTSSKVAIGIVATDWLLLKPNVEKVVGWQKPSITEIETPDEIYKVIYFDDVCWYGDAVDEIMDTLSHVRHSFLQMTEEGVLTQDILTEDCKGADEEFYELISWKTDFYIWGDESHVLGEPEYEIPRERLFQILQDYVEADAEAASEAGYIRDMLMDTCGCSKEEMKALGFGYLITE